MRRICSINTSIKALIFLLYYLSRGNPVSAAYINSHNGNDERKLYIPLILHIVYHTEEENISLAQIQSQITSLNKDFQGINEDLTSIDPAFITQSADVELEFFLADTLLNTNSIGIQRVPSEEDVFTPTNLFSSEMGGSTPIAPERYLNIWVANLSPDLLGFNDDRGVAIDYQSFGTVGTSLTPYHLGRTLTHEIGHFLSLDHPWGTGGCDTDDGIEDTPNQEAAWSTCEGDLISCESKDMAQNFMNLATDECLLFFTEGQKNRMRSFLQEELPGLVRDEYESGTLITKSNDVLEKTQVYPNPANEFILVDNKSSSTTTITMKSLEGKALSSHIILPNTTANSINLSDLSDGIYFANIMTDNQLEILKIILSRSINQKKTIR